MWQALVVCSSCTEEEEILVEELEDLDREVCPCGYSYVAVSVAGFEPVFAESAEVIELRPRRLTRAAA